MATGDEVSEFGGFQIASAPGTGIDRKGYHQK
jgi:hypothetical protein